MTKKLISVWLSLTILLFSSISIYAEENIQGDFFIKDITINGEKIVNNQLQYPFFLYNDATYLPLTPEMGQICGFRAEMDYESRTLKLLKVEPTLTNITQRWCKNSKQDVQTQVYDDLAILVYELKSEDQIEQKERNINTEVEVKTGLGKDGISKDEAQTTDISKREINLDGLPILIKGNVIYLPIKVLTGDNGLGWDQYFDSYTGVYVSTNKGTAAVSYWKEAESRYNRGLTNYIMKYNGGYTPSKAKELVAMFKQAAQTYKIDEKVLMAVAHKESTFNANAKGGGGALGMMQVMPSTGTRYGLTREDLLDAQTSIDFAAMYLSERIDAYDGSLVKGFSAYNQGSVSVNRGTHSTRYANNVIGTVSGIDSYLKSNGYGTGE